MERILSLFLMIIVSGIVCIGPIILFGRSKINIRKNLIFIIFWYQAWLYLCLVPMINCMIPNSKFAFPEHMAEMRMIRFTDDEVFLYALLQFLIILLFFIPMLLIYIKKNDSRSKEMPTNQYKISFIKLLLLVLIYSISIFCYCEVIYRTGLYNAYALNVEILLSMNQTDRFIMKLLSPSIFLLSLIILAYFEKDWADKWKKRMLFIVLIPGIVLHIIIQFTSSRTAMLFSIVSIVLILIIRGHVEIRRKAIVKIILVFAIITFFTLSITPTLRGAIYDPDLSIPQLLTILSPLSDKESKVQPDFLSRLDGIELMVLSIPFIEKQGFVPMSWYFIPLISPILPLFPALENEVKIYSDIADFKKRYLQSHTPAITPDYVAVSFTELFMILGPLGFLIAGVLLGLSLHWCNNLLKRSGDYLIVGIFILNYIFIFELPMVNIITGWVKGLPIFLLAILCNPWRKSVRNKSFSNVP